MPGPDLTPDELAEARRQKAAKRSPEQQAIMDAYVVSQKSRPATTMTHDEQVADFSRRHQEARSKRIIALAKARGQKMAADRAAGIEQSPAGSYFKEKALADAGGLGQAGQSVRDGAHEVLDATDTTAAKVGGVVTKVLTGGDVRGIVQNTAVLSDLAGQAMIANDEKIKSGLENSQERNEASSDDLAGKVTALQSAAKGSTERKAAALAAFKSAGTRARDQAELGAMQDLSMKTGLREYSKDEVLGSAHPESLDYSEGDVVKREDAMHGSTYGKVKRAVQTGGLSTSGKLSDAQKTEIAGIQQDLDSEQAARTAEHEARNAGSLKGQIKRTALMQGSKLTDSEKAEIERITAAKATHETDAKATETQLRDSKEQVRKQIEALKAQQPKLLVTAARKAQHADLQRQIDALQPSLAEGRKKLADHRAATKAASEEFDGQVGDIHARADGGFTRAEKAARAAKEQKITDIRTGATAAENFTDKHAGQTINHYGRVGGMIDRMEDPSKMAATTMGTIADYANKGGEHLEDAGMILGGSADDARKLQEQAKYLKSGLAAGVGVGVETAKLAGATLPGAGHLGDGTQKALSTGMKGLGQITQAVTADAAAEEREREASRDVVSGDRRRATKTASFVTTRRPSKDAPTVLGGLGELVKGTLAADGVKDGIMEAVGLGDNENEASAGGDESTSASSESTGTGAGDADAEHGATGDDTAHDAGPVDGHEVGGGHPGGGDLGRGAVEAEVTTPPTTAHVSADASENAMIEAPNDGPAPELQGDQHVGGGEHGGGAPVVDEEQAGGGGPVGGDQHVGGGEHGGGAPVVDEEHAGGGGPVGDGEHGGEPDGSEAEKDEAHDPRLEEERPKSFGEKVLDNAKGEAYEQGADNAVDRMTGRAGAFLAAPVATVKADAPVKALASASPTPSPGPGPARQRLPWWKRLWRAIKRGARRVGRGIATSYRSVKRGLSAAGRRIKSFFS